MREHFRHFLHGLWRAEDGQDLVEYGLILALIAVVVAASLPAFTVALGKLWTAVDAALKTAAS